MPEVRLPNGMTLSCLQKHDVAIVNAEVQTYFENGITVKSGDTIIVVGANIGLFALAAWDRTQGNIQVHCFEPIAPIFNILEQNLRRCDDQSPTAHPFGLSDASGFTEFAHYPHAPVLSTAYPENESDFREVKQATLDNILYMPEAPFQLKVLKLFPIWLRELILDMALRQTLQYDTVQCEIKTLSQFIFEHGLTSIDLLKIDAEKAEFDILMGIDSQDWPIIQQIVVDVHDIDNRLQRVLELLHVNGFQKITVEQPPTLIGSTIYTLLATR